MGDCMRCIHCEHELEQGTIYCSNCGKRQIEHNAILCIKANYSKIRVITIALFTLILLVSSLGSVSKHYGGSLEINGTVETVTFTQNIFHYLEGFKHLVLNTSELEYNDVRYDDIQSYPLGETIDEYTYAYSHRNLVGKTFVETQSIIGISILIFNVVLIGVMISFPLFIFVFVPLNLALKTEKKFDLKWMFLIMFLASSLLSRLIIPVYDLKSDPSNNLIFYMCVSLTGFILLLVLDTIKSEYKEYTKKILYGLVKVMPIIILLVVSGNQVSVKSTYLSESRNGTFDYNDVLTDVFRGLPKRSYQETEIYRFIVDVTYYFKDVKQADWYLFRTMNIYNTEKLHSAIYYYNIGLVFIIGALATTLTIQLLIKKENIIIKNLFYVSVIMQLISMVAINLSLKRYYSAFNDFLTTNRASLKFFLPIEFYLGIVLILVYVVVNKKRKTIN